MTDLEYLRQYWARADAAEEALLKKVRGLHPEDAVQAALDRFGRTDGTARLDNAELNRLHRNVKAWGAAGILTGEFGLRARDAANRKRITNDEAMLLYLMAAWSEYYSEVERETVKMFVDVTGAREALVKERLSQPTPTTPTGMTDALAVDAAYRARQLHKLAVADRQQGQPQAVTQKRYVRVFDQERNWLLAPSEPTEAMPNGHHGYIDREMAELLSYFAIEEYRRQGVKRVRFVAVIDEKTTQNCRRLHGQVFGIDDLRPGINTPPIADPPHSCRSVLKPLESLQIAPKSDIIYSQDIEIGRSVGAAVFRDPVKLPDGKTARLAEGTKITKVYVFAGKGAKKPVRVAEMLAKQYHVTAEEWQHTRGDGYVDVNGEIRHAELHWFEHPDVGRVKMKVKRWFD